MCVIQTALVFQSLPDNMEMLMPSHGDAERTGDEECYHGTDGFMKEAHTHTHTALAYYLTLSFTHGMRYTLINIHHTHRYRV